MGGVITVDPEFEALIPPLSADERSQLEKNILADGCRDPISLWGQVVVDGHNRFAICCDYGIEFETVQVHTIASRDDAILWMVANQLGRRNIPDFVRVELALRAKPIIEARAKAKQVASGGAVRLKSDEPVRTDVAVAQAAGVGKDTVRNVERVQDTAVPEVLAAARAGTVSISKAAKIAKLPEDEQVEAMNAPAAKRPKTPVVDAVTAADPKEEEFGPSDDEIRASEQDAADEIESLRRVVEANDQIAAAMEEVKRYREDNRKLKERVNGLITEKNQAIRLVKSWRSKYEKLEKAAS